jgi:hypothetical protein
MGVNGFPDGDGILLKLLSSESFNRSGCHLAYFRRLSSPRMDTLLIRLEPVRDPVAEGT